MFYRIIPVATGSGIDSYADAVFEGHIPVRLLWTSPNVGEDFSDVFLDQILRCVPDVVLYDTRKHGNPGLVKFFLKMVKEFNAEVVGVILLRFYRYQPDIGAAVTVEQLSPEPFIFHEMFFLFPRTNR